MTLLGMAHLAVLVVALGMTLAATYDELSDETLASVFGNGEHSEEWDEFVPPSESQFDPFDWRLCQLVHKREKGNVVLSPVSLKLLLAMVYEGATNKTALELKSALDLPDSRLETRNKYFSILKELQTKQPEFNLEIASKMFLRKDLSAKIRFAKIMRSFYSAGLQNLDFSKQSEAVRIINSWVSNATKGHISSMFTEDLISPSTVLVLLNAIYFKGFWKYPFNPNSTAMGSFQVTPTKSIEIPFMNLTEHLYFSQSVQLDAKILRLPYKGKKYSMFIVLPNKVDGLDKLLLTINPFLLRQHMFLMDQDAEINVILPKFQLEFTTELQDILEEMGVREMFTENAQFPNMIRSGSVYVSNILQKAGLEVNEEGTEAFASTSIQFDDRIGKHTEDFHVKHPFMFFIQDEKTGTVIFVGKVTDPSSGQASLRTASENEAKEDGLLGRMAPNEPVNQPPGDKFHEPQPKKSSNDFNYSRKSKSESKISTKVWEYLYFSYLKSHNLI